MPSDEELCVVRAYIARTVIDKDEPHGVLKALYEQRMAFPDTYAWVAAITAFGCSTAVCESSFSALSRIETPQRQGMKVDRLQKLTLLAFERERTKKIDLEKFLRRFSESKSRRLQLY